MHSSKNKFFFNSAPAKPKPAANLHDYYKSYADQQRHTSITNSEPHKSIKATSQVRLKSDDNRSPEITFQNNKIVVRNNKNSNTGIFNSGNNQKLVLRKKNNSENETTNADLKRKNSKKLVSSSLNLDRTPNKPPSFIQDQASSKQHFFIQNKGNTQVDSPARPEPRKSKDGLKLPKIDTGNELAKSTAKLNNPPQISSTNPISHQLESSKIDSSGLKTPSKLMVSPQNKPIGLDENVMQLEESSPILHNRNIRVITKHSIVPIKSESKPPAQDLRSIEENANEKADNKPLKNNESPLNIDYKKNKRLSDIGLSPDDISKLLSKVEETKDKDASKPKNSGVMVFGGSKQEADNENAGSLSPMKNSNVYHYDPNAGMSPQKSNKTVQNFAFKSKAGAMPGNTPKTNQDVYIALPSFASSKDRYFFGVCDGHGVNGHLVSGYIKQNLPRFTEKVFKEQNENESAQMIKNAMHEGHLSTLHGLLDTNIDSNFSGSTSVTMLITTDRRLYCANVGDSRAIMCKNRNNTWSAAALSRDQKPDDPLEMQRILKNGGRVEAFKDFMGNPVGPARVWLKHENIPGLAMARSIGDRIAAQVGVIAEPEIKEFEITDDDKFIVIASDGVWEFLSNQQVMNYVLPFYQKNQPEAACEKLIKESVICWKREDEVIDDITAVVIFLNLK